MRDKTTGQVCSSNAIYIYFSFFHACGKNKLFQTRLYARRDCFEDFYEFWKQGGRLAGHLEKFFQVSSRAVDRYLCRGNYQRLRWRYGDPTKDKNFGAWASSPQVSRRWVYEKGAAPILGERIHLRGDREHLEGVSVSNDAFQDAQKKLLFYKQKQWKKRRDLLFNIYTYYSSFVLQLFGKIVRAFER